MTTEERLEALEKELARAKRRNRWSLTGTALVFVFGAILCGTATGPSQATAQPAVGTVNEVLIPVSRADMARANESGRSYLSDVYAEAVLKAINAVEVPPFAYASSDYEPPNEANVSITADQTTGETLLVVRLRQGTARIPDCIAGIVNAGFLCDFEYMRWKEPGFRTGAAIWRAGSKGMWDAAEMVQNVFPHPIRVDFHPSRITIEVYSVRDSVLSWWRLGADRVRDAKQQSERAGFISSDVEFYWLLQRALPFVRADDRVRLAMQELLSGGPGVTGGRMYDLARPETDMLSLASVQIPVLSSTPKDIRLVERWTFSHTMRTSVRIGDQGAWTTEQVRSAAKVVRF
jgi:hypothetical protein